MIDKILDRMADYRVKVLEKRAARKEKLYTAEKKVADVEKKFEAIRPKRTNYANSTPGAKGPGIIDKLGDFGAYCAQASETMNHNLFGDTQNASNAELERKK